MLTTAPKSDAISQLWTAELTTEYAATNWVLDNTYLTKQNSDIESEALI